MSKALKDNTIITMPVATLRETLTLIGSSINGRHTLPILSHACLSFDNDGVRIIGTDLEVEQRTLFPISDTVSAESYDSEGNAVESGAFTAPHKKLLDILKQVPGDSIAMISCNKKTHKVILKVSGQRSSYRLSSFDATDYPTIELDDVKSKMLLEASTLLSLTSPVEGSMANKDVRYYLNGMNLSKSGSELTAVSTDGHRLSLNVVSVLKQNGKDMNCILPRDGYKAFVHYLKSLAPDTQVKLMFMDNHIVLHSEGKTLISKQVDGKFPDYNRVIPKENEVSLSVDRLELLNACKRAGILANEKFRGVRINLTDSAETDSFELVSNNPEQEEASEEVCFKSLTGMTGDFELGLNIDYLINALTTLNSDEVTIKLRDENSSIIVSDGGELLHVVMPMRL